MGGLLWIVVCRWGLEKSESGPRWVWPAGPIAAARPAFNPLAAFQGVSGRLAVFLAIRFAGLVVIVPLIEEFFLRGF